MTAKERKLIDPATISQFKKLRFLKEFTEDDFRDRVVRPLFRRMNFTDGRDLCGPDEQGKDTIFLTTNPLGHQDLYAIQTKKGSLNLARKATSNIIEAITQLRTALATAINIASLGGSRKPDRVLLCVSGKINLAARNHIAEEIRDNRVLFYDADDLIPKVDELYGELWYGIDADRNPYLSQLCRELLDKSDAITVNKVASGGESFAPISDGMYIPVSVYRITTKAYKHKGQVEQRPYIEEFSATALPSKQGAPILLLGNAGDGKTTAIRRIAYSLAGQALELSGDVKIPILLSAGDVFVSTRKLIDLAAAKTTSYVAANRSAFTVDDLSSGNVMLLIDGLDELAQEAERVSVLEKVIEFSTEYPKCTVILATRPYESILQLAARGKSPGTLRASRNQWKSRANTEHFGARDSSRCSE